MPLPSVVTFNELNGEEVRAVLENRFQQIMQQVPCFQRHLTLPRVRMTLNVKLEVWADQPQPEAVKLSDTLTVAVEIEPEPSATFEAESVDSTAPTPGGQPPDLIREMHNLPISQPGPGDRAIGAHIATSDGPVYLTGVRGSTGPSGPPAQLDGTEVERIPGLKISRTGSGVIDGMPTSANATVAKIDQGPAGLRRGEMNRDRWQFSGGKR